MSDISGINSLYSSDYMKSSTQTADLESKLSNTKDMSDDELMGVCKDFEAYFVEQMYKAMKKMVPEDDVSKSKEVQMFGDQLTQKYAETTAENDQFGLAKTLYEQMKRNYGL